MPVSIREVAASGRLSRVTPTRAARAVRSPRAAFADMSKPKAPSGGHGPYEGGLKVIGTGPGRTGTSSLKAALEILYPGQKCYHMRAHCSAPHGLRHDPTHCVVFRLAPRRSRPSARRRKEVVVNGGPFGWFDFWTRVSKVRPAEHTVSCFSTAFAPCGAYNGA